MAEDPEEILSSALSTLYDYAPITYAQANERFRFVYSGPAAGDGDVHVQVNTPDTTQSNWSLHAGSVWVASVYLARNIHRVLPDAKSSDHRPLAVLELGASASLPSILLARLRPFPLSRVVTSDYPDPLLIRTLEDNIRCNNVERCVKAVRYDWCADHPTPLFHALAALGQSAEANTQSSFDLVLCADTLWSPTLHEPLLRTITSTLARTSSARAHLVAGLHTGRYTIQAFLSTIDAKSKEPINTLVVADVVEWRVEAQESGVNQRPWSVERAEYESEADRRAWVVWITLKWAERRL